MRLLFRVLLVFAPIMVGGCNFLSTPSASFLNRCFRLPSSSTIGGPLSTLLEGLKYHEFSVSWSRGAQSSFILRARKTNPLNNARHELAIVLTPMAGRLPEDNDCGPDTVVPSAFTVDGEDLNAFAGDQLLLGIMEEVIRAKEATRSKNGQVTPVAAAPPSTQTQPVDSGSAAGSVPNASDNSAASEMSEGQAENFVAEWNKVNSLPGQQALEWLQHHYADEVTFFGKETSRDDILAQKRSFLERWPLRTYTIVPPLKIHCVSGDVRCSVEGTMQFRTENPSTGRGSQGTASFELGFSFVSDQPTITYESSKVLSRR